MTTAEKLQKIAENEQRVFDAGKQAEYDAFWDMYQINGTRTGYDCAFAGAGWTNTLFKPKYNMRPENGYMTFRNSGITGDLVEMLDNLGVVLDFSNLKESSQYMFGMCSITHLGVIDLSSIGATRTNANYFFYGATKLHTIDKLILPTKQLTLGYAFNGCTALANLTIEGTIQYDIDFKSCPLTHDSLMSIINALGDGLSYTLTIGATNLAKLTQDEIDIAEAKGWTVK